MRQNHLIMRQLESNLNNHKSGNFSKGVPIFVLFSFTFWRENQVFLTRSFLFLCRSIGHPCLLPRSRERTESQCIWLSYDMKNLTGLKNLRETLILNLVVQSYFNELHDKYVFSQRTQVNKATHLLICFFLQYRAWISFDEQWSSSLVELDKTCKRWYS